MHLYIYIYKWIKFNLERAVKDGTRKNPVYHTSHLRFTTHTNNLMRWGISEDGNCNLCKKPGHLEHV